MVNLFFVMATEQPNATQLTVVWNIMCVYSCIACEASVGARLSLWVRLDIIISPRRYLDTAIEHTLVESCHHPHRDRHRLIAAHATSKRVAQADETTNHERGGVGFPSNTFFDCAAKHKNYVEYLITTAESRK